MLIVSMTDRRLMRFASGKLAVEAELSSIATGLCNDMIVDARGRAYVGNFGFDRMPARSRAPRCWPVSIPMDRFMQRPTS